MTSTATPSAAPTPAEKLAPKRRFRIVSRGALKRLAILFLLMLVALVYGYFAMVRMPGRSHTGPLPPLTEAQRELAQEMRVHVEILSDATGGVGRAGNRSTYYPRRFAQAAKYIDDQLAAIGFTDRKEYFVERGAPVPNIEVTIPGTSHPAEIVIVGAHYDCFQGTPGADDNASGVAACLALARRFIAEPQPSTLKFVFFVNEEPPAFWTRDMGSWVYARACRARNDNIVAMLSLEGLGYFRDHPGSQQYPEPIGALYPDTADFIAIVGNYASRSLVKRAITVFREEAQFPSQGAALPTYFPGVGLSDQWSFWQEGYPGLMVTDTAMFRNPYYHTPQDKAETLDYDRMARVVSGLMPVIRDCAAPK